MVSSHGKLLQNLEQNDPDFRKRRFWTITAYWLQTFFTNIQYSIVDASLYVYLLRFQAKPWFYGFILAMYEVGCVLSFPFSGIYFDYTKQSKAALYFINSLFIIGSVIFMLPYSKWFVLAGRTISGFGEAFRPIMDAEITWMYQHEDRLIIYTYNAFAMFGGIALGPAVNSIFLNAHFYMGSILIDYGNISGLVMGAIWILMQIFIHYTVSDIAKELDGLYVNYAMLAEEDNSIEVEWSDTLETKVETEAENDKDLKEQYTITELLSIIAKRLFSVISFTVMIGFIDFFTGRAGHALSYLVLYKLWGWSTTEVTFFSILIASDIILSLFATQFLGPLITETGILFLSLTFLVVGSGLMATYSHVWAYYLSKEIAFCAGIVFFVASFSIHLPAAKTLVSKICRREIQGSVQAIALVARRTGFILAPLVANWALYHIQIAGGLFCGLTTIFTLLFILLYSSIEAKKAQQI